MANFSNLNCKMEMLGFGMGRWVIEVCMSKVVEEDEKSLLDRSRLDMGGNSAVASVGRNSLFFYSFSSAFSVLF